MSPAQMADRIREWSGADVSEKQVLSLIWVAAMNPELQDDLNLLIDQLRSEYEREYGG